MEQISFNRNARLFEYEPAEVDTVTVEAIEWANDRHAEVAEELSSLYAPLELTFVRPPRGAGEQATDDGDEVL
jgi:hypothetical protein